MPTCLLLAGLVQLLPVAIALVGREPLVRHDNEHLRHDQADDEDVAAHHPCGSAMSPLSIQDFIYQQGDTLRDFKQLREKSPQLGEETRCDGMDEVGDKRGRIIHAGVLGSAR